jgi:hypothetical protein
MGVPFFEVKKKPAAVSAAAGDRWSCKRAG